VAVSASAKKRNEMKWHSMCPTIHLAMYQPLHWWKRIFESAIFNERKSAAPIYLKWPEEMCQPIMKYYYSANVGSNGRKKWNVA
jgi:hypothetical protein